jgi:hypothetical protein
MEDLPKSHLDKIEMKLISKTLKGKNILHKSISKGSDGDWEILQQEDTVLFSNEIGPWIKIVPLDKDGERIMSLCRWIHATNDKDLDTQI